MTTIYAGAETSDSTACPPAATAWEDWPTASPTRLDLRHPHHPDNPESVFARYPGRPYRSPQTRRSLERQDYPAIAPVLVLHLPPRRPVC